MTLTMATLRIRLLLKPRRLGLCRPGSLHDALLSSPGTLFLLACMEPTRLVGVLLLGDSTSH